MRKIDLLDTLPLLLQDHALLEHDVLQVGRKQRQVLRGEPRQKQIAPARMGAIELHLRPFQSSEPVPQIPDSAPTTRPPTPAKGTPPAGNLSVRYPTKSAANER